MENNEMMVQGGYGTPQAITAGVTRDMATTREAQEVQAAVFMAKRFPRDENQAIARIAQSCKRRGLAEKAIYTYPKGGQNVTGPSIRLAEAIAQSWGNLQCGVVELSQEAGESTCMAYCWDIETNFRDTKVFTVPHAIQTRNGTKQLTDPRDIYEHVANQGARRKRACILAVIPKDVVDSALEACQKTLASGYKEPLIDRLRKMVDVFRNEFSVPLESIEKYIGYKLDSFTEMDMVTLRGVYTALKEGSSKREDYFDLPKVVAAPAAPEPEAAPAEPEQVSLHDL
ncbi:MAG: hypothetical protein ACI3VA_02110 [Candidatus Limivicinus sp.]